MHTFNGTFSGSSQVCWYQKGKTNLDFTEARDSEWQWHQLGHKQVCALLQTDIHASTPLHRPHKSEERTAENNGNNMPKLQQQHQST